MVRSGFIDKNKIDSSKVIDDIKKLAKRNRVSVTEMSQRLGAKTNGWCSAFRQGDRNMPLELLNNLIAQAHRPINYYLRDYEEPVETKKDVEPDPEFMAFCVALFNAYKSGCTTDITIRIAQHK